MKIIHHHGSDLWSLAKLEKHGVHWMRHELTLGTAQIRLNANLDRQRLAEWHLLRDDGWALVHSNRFFVQAIRQIDLFQLVKFWKDPWHHGVSQFGVLPIVKVFQEWPHLWNIAPFCFGACLLSNKIHIWNYDLRDECNELNYFNPDVSAVEAEANQSRFFFK